MRSFRCSVLSMMETEGKNYFTHPMFLAPFIVVSEGGRRCDSRSNHRSAASRANVAHDAVDGSHPQASRCQNGGFDEPQGNRSRP